MKMKKLIVCRMIDEEEEQEEEGIPRHHREAAGDDSVDHPIGCHRHCLHHMGLKRLGRRGKGVWSQSSRRGLERVLLNGGVGVSRGAGQNKRRLLLWTRAGVLKVDNQGIESGDSETLGDRWDSAGQEDIGKETRFSQGLHGDEMKTDPSKMKSNQLNKKKRPRRQEKVGYRTWF